MNISHDGKTVSFKTVPEELFLAEKSGAKPNTVRIIDHYEYKQLKKKQPEKIMIRHKHGIFLRTLVHVYVSEMILGKYLAIFSWTNVKHLHTISADNNFDPLAHTMSLGATAEPPIDMSTIDLPKSLINRMGRYIGNDTFPEFISKLLNDIPLVQPQPQTDERFVCVTISKNLHLSLEAIRHGRSMNMVMQELLESSQYKQYNEEGAGKISLNTPIDMSQTAILIPRTLLADMNWHRGKDTLPEFISKLLKDRTGGGQ